MTSPQIAALADAFERCRDLDAPLNERLDAYSLAVRKLIPPYADAVDRLVARLSGMAFGSNSRISCKRFSANTVLTIQMPVMFPPGWLKLATKPNLIGSAPVTKTIGMLVVAALAASTAGGPSAQITATCRWTRSAAI